MMWFAIVLAIVIVCFGVVLLFGAPYLPTLTPQVHAALELADIKPGDTLLELGCGDGRVLIAAAQVGAKAIGYELNPILAFIAWIRTRRFGDKVHIIFGDFWRETWPDSDVIFVFLLQRYMKKLDTKIVQNSKKPVKVVSFAFHIPDRTPSATKDGVLLYNYE